MLFSNQSFISQKPLLKNSNLESISSSRNSRKNTMTQSNKEHSLTSRNTLKDEIKTIEIMQKGERELKKKINSIKHNKVNSLINLHKNCLKESFANNFYITKVGECTLNNLIEKCNHTDIESNESDKKQVNFDRNSNFNTIDPDLKLLNLGKSKNPSRNLSNSTSRLNFYSKILLPVETVRNFTDKVKDISRNKFLIEIKKEKILQIKEGYFNQIGELNERMKFSYQTNKFLGDNFLITYDKYFKCIVHKKEIEKTELYDLLNLKIKLDLEIKSLISLISKNNHLHQNYMRYKNFVICVNEGISRLPESYYKLSSVELNLNLNLYQSPIKNENANLNSKFDTIYIDSQSKKSLSSKKESTFIKLGKIASTSVNKRSSLLIKNDAITNGDANIKLFPYKGKEKASENSKYFNLSSVNDIFNSPTEFIQKIKSFEKEIITKMQIYCENKQKIFNLLNENKKFLYDLKEEDDYFHRNINDKEEQLKKLKLRHNMLQIEKDKLVESYKISLKMDKNYSNTEIKFIKRTHNIFNKEEFNMNKGTNLLNLQKSKNFIEVIFKINKINNKLKENVPNLFLENINKEKDKEGNCENQTKHMLSEIERVFNFLLSRYNFYLNSKDHNKILHKLEETIDKNITNKKSSLTRMKENLRKEKMESYIKQKENIIYILPKRKVADKVKPNDKINKTNNLIAKENLQDLEFYKLISYDINEN